MICHLNAQLRRCLLAALIACFAVLCAAPARADTHVLPAEEVMESLEDIVYPEVVDGFLPVFFSRRNAPKVVAFTIDDCNQPANLRAMISLFQKYGGTATIFPIGENVRFLNDTLKSAWQAGFEIENHTWNHSGLYHEDDEGMCHQIWDQNRAVSEALGVNYQMHFLRPRGGDNRYDQRTHAYLRQLGYYGIAYWSKVGVNQSNDYIIKNIHSGDILLFHTTDEDLKRMRDLVPKLYKKGYTFVTLNELFGLPDNETSELTDADGPEPLQPYTRFDQTLHQEDYLHDVYLVQEKLSQLGFLNSKYNGYYGAKTVAAVAAFQKSRGLTVDGVCGRDTWAALFGESEGGK
ncbi:MAG: polysaccharide deacetylase family protein [Clostridia bacterium]|nr:polysaccharide deacetylase family protein [Clostridia bacterium]